MEQVVSAFEAPLLRYATRLLQNATLAQDVVQNVFIKLFRAWRAGMEPDERLQGWLFRVAHNEAVDLIRAEERRRRLHDAHAADQTRCHDGLHCDAPADEREATVLRCLHALAPSERQVLLLRLQQGLRYEEIAAATGRTVGGVGNLLHHAVRKLAERVRRAEEAV
jgi:RNA polymerase sigma-70 factor (ECF subfamily)